MTSTLTGEANAAIFIAIDHRIVQCVGVHVARHGTRFESLEPSAKPCATTSAPSAI